MQFNRTKFKAMVHYICANSPFDKLGFVKLHKIAYFADMLHYVQTGEALTGEVYRKQQFGPVAQHLWEIIDQLQREGAIRVESRDYFGYQKKDFISARSPNTENFDETELSLINNVINFACDRTAKELSELSHEYAWQSAKIGEVLPYFTALQMFPVEVKEEDIMWGAQEAEEIVNKGLRAV